MSFSYDQIISFIVFVICIISCLKQVNDLLKIYFEYRIYARIKIETVNPQLPTITLCPSIHGTKYANQIANLNWM